MRRPAAVVALLVSLAAAVSGTVSLSERAHAEGASAGAWEILPPIPQRAAACAVIDTRHQRWVVYGGSSAFPVDTAGVWVLPLSGNGTWGFIRGAGSPPPHAAGRSAMYDPVRDRLVLCGGGDGVWALSLGSSPTWSRLGDEPWSGTGHRVAASAVYDAVADRMLIFGGWDGSRTRGVLMAYSFSSGSPGWQVLSDGFPGLARYTHVAAFDAQQDRLIVFGGVCDGRRLNDTWVCDLSGSPTWTQLAPGGTPPTPRFWPAGAWDASNQRLVVYGGYDGQGCADTWVLSLAGTPAWTQLSPAGPPPSARWLHMAGYDPVQNRLLLLGGLDSTSSYYQRFHYIGLAGSDWTLSLGDTPMWAPLASAPSPRVLHSAILDAANNRVVLFGGVVPSGPAVPAPAGHCFNDVWTLQLSTPGGWTQLLPAGTPPSPRYEHSAIYDPVRRRMLVLGGRDSTASFDELWSLSLTDAPTWTQLSPTGDWPGVGSAIYDPVRDRVVSLSPNTQVGLLSLASEPPAWSTLAIADTLQVGLSDNGAVYDPVRDRMVVYGGLLDGYQYTGNVYALSLGGTPHWTQLATGSLRMNPGCGYDPLGDRLIVAGAGRYAVVPTGDETRFPEALPLADGSSWTTLVTDSTDYEAFVAGVAAVWDPSRNRLLLLGGQNAAIDTTAHFFPAFAFDLSATATVRRSLPAAVRLAAPRPNPAFGSSTLSFELPVATRVTLDVFDIAGRRLVRLAEGRLPAGRHERTWTGRDAAGNLQGAGVFFVRLEADGVRATRRLVRLGGRP